MLKQWFSAYVTCSACTGILDDLWIFEPIRKAWTEISPLGSKPKPRLSSGITSMGNGQVYLYGGWDGQGKILCT
jgi:hypothetical protein